MSKEIKEIKKIGFAFGKENYRILIIGVIIVVLGYLLMIGGGSDDPNQFHADEIFSTRRVTIAPITILVGFVVVLFGIMKKNARSGVFFVYVWYFVVVQILTGIYRVNSQFTIYDGKFFLGIIVTITIIVIIACSVGAQGIDKIIISGEKERWKIET